MCFGSDFFLHEILYRFLPVYVNFRFPSINRCIVAMFTLLNIASVLNEIMCQKMPMFIYKFSKSVFCISLTMAVTFGLIGNMANESFGLDKERMLKCSDSAWITVIVVGGYLVLFSMLFAQNLKGRVVEVGFIVVVVMDVVTFHHAEYPATIASYNHIGYSFNSDIRNLVQNEFEKNRNRNKTVEFANSIRANSKGDNSSIVYNKYFDEDGYISVQLQNTQEYKKTYLRSIMEQNPEIYFTNDVVTQGDVEYDIWANSGTTPPEQIYVNEDPIVVENKIRFKQKALSKEEVSVVLNGETAYIEGTFSTGNNGTSRLQLWYDSEITKMKELTVTFYDNNGNCQQYSGEYETKLSEEGCFVDLYFPNVDAIYTRVDIVSSDSIPPTSIALVDVERMHEDDYVDINSFTFNDISLTVNAPTDGYVAILQAKYKGWKAYVDGADTAISTVNNCFMGVKVPAGTHEIVLRFRPYDFYIGMIISVLFFCVLVFMLIKLIFSRKKNEREVVYDIEKCETE